jgi:hypothetical protein
VAAPRAARSTEAVGQHPAAQVRAKLLDHVPRERLARALLGEAREGLQCFATRPWSVVCVGS